MSARLAMPLGTPASKTSEAIRTLETTAEQVRQEFIDETGEDVFKNVLASVGDQPLQGARNRNAGERGSFSAAHLGEVGAQQRHAGRLTRQARYDLVDRTRTYLFVGESCRDRDCHPGCCPTS